MEFVKLFLQGLDVCLGSVSSLRCVNVILGAFVNDF